MGKEKLVLEYNQETLDMYTADGPVTLGIHTSYTWRNDPKHILFSLSRYKFCSKLLLNKKSALDIGCGDGLGMPILLQSVEKVHGIDIESAVIKNCNDLNEHKNRCSFEVLDVVKQSPSGQYDAVISMDVIEHISHEKEKIFLKNIFSPLAPHGIAIVGTPNADAARHASQISKSGHINLKDYKSFIISMQQFFNNVFIFSMNDEVVHTGFYPMAHYLVALCTDKKNDAFVD